MPVKFGKSQVKVDRNTKKVTIEHEYMKCQSIDTLIEAYNKEGQRPKLKQKVKNEIVRRNKLGLCNVVFKPKDNELETCKHPVGKMICLHAEGRRFKSLHPPVIYIYHGNMVYEIIRGRNDRIRTPTAYLHGR